MAMRVFAVFGAHYCKHPASDLMQNYIKMLGKHIWNLRAHRTLAP